MKIGGKARANEQLTAHQVIVESKGICVLLCLNAIPFT